MNKVKSTIHRSVGGRNFEGLSLDSSCQATDADFAAIKNCGYDFSPQYIRERHASYVGQNQDHPEWTATGFDAVITPGVTAPSIATPVQFAQAWLPGIVNVQKAPKMADIVLGMQTVGDWADTEIVQTWLEHSGTPSPYTDESNMNTSGINVNFETRTIYRGQMAAQVGLLEQAMMAKIRVSDGDEKRFAVIDALDIQRNNIAFSGFNAGKGQTYGMLNDPGLGAAETTTPFSGMDYLAIVNEIITWFAALQTQSNGVVNPQMVDTTLAIPVSVDQFFNITSTNGAQGYSVRKWLSDTYPRCRIVTIPQFEASEAGVSTAMLFAETIDNSGTDDSRVWIQVVPARLKALNVRQYEKGYSEGYSNATAGAFLKRPYANVLITGL